MKSKPNNPSIYILSQDDFDRIETLTEQYKMALYEFIDSRELELVSPPKLRQEGKFFKTANKMIWEALGDDDIQPSLF